MLKVISFLIIIFVYNSLSIAMENKPYHHLPDGTFRNPEGSPERNPSFNWSYKIFNKEKRKLNMDIPAGHIINKNEVLENLSKNKNNDRGLSRLNTKSNKALRSALDVIVEDELDPNMGTPIDNITIKPNED